MQHEAWYKSGIHASDDLSICIGWVNHPHAFSDCMPVVNEAQDLVLILTGEVFSDPDEIQRLKSKGHQFSDGDASHLVHLYEELGDSFFEKLNGCFSGVLLDLRRKRAVLFNDRYGMQRIFVHESTDGFYFASEAKALLSVLPETREFDPEGLGQFLTCGCTFHDRSLYKKISVLPPASWWVFDGGKVSCQKNDYFKPAEWEGQPRLEEKEFLPIMLESFGKLVARYTTGSLPIGMSLTGGLDSRMVMACLGNRASKFPCFTFASPYRDTFDVQTAREVAKTCGQSHHALALDADFLQDFPQILKKSVYVSDGYIGMSGAAELYGNALARELAPVRLTGNWGGELLRGDRAFKYNIPQGNFVAPGLQPHLLTSQTLFQELEQANALTFTLFHQLPCQGYGRMATERSQVILRTPFLDNDLAKLIYQAPPQLLAGERLSFALISHYNPALLKIPTDRGLLYNDWYLRNIARRFYREALFKAEYWSAHGMPNWLAIVSDYGLRGFLEKNFIGRHKFQHFSKWTREALGDYVNEMLGQNASDLPEFFDRSEVNKMVQLHLSGKRNYVNEIDKLLTITLAAQTLLKLPDKIENNRAAPVVTNSAPN